MAAELCFSDQCAIPSDVPELYDMNGRKTLCRLLRNTIVEAGGAGALEIHPCPIDVIDSLRDQDNDSLHQAAAKLTMRKNLGISFDMGSET